MKQIVIIGGGFAGVNFVKGMVGSSDFEVTLVDRNNYNFFPPLLYQIATGFLEPASISYPFRKLFRKPPNIRFRLGEFQQLLPHEKKIILSTGVLHFDYLVFATGVETNYFGMENIKAHSLPMKTLNDALELRNHILQQMELAEFAETEIERQKLLTIVVAGGGPTGVEVSGMLADMRKFILPKDYRQLSTKGYSAKIYLVDAVDVVLKPMSEKSHTDTYKALTDMGVEVRLNRQVKDYVNDTVIFTNGDNIPTKTLVWAAGVTGSTFDGMPAACYGRGKRLIVDQFNQVVGMENVFAVGDTCFQTHDPRYPSGHPQLAQVGIQQGANLARNLVALAQSKPLKEFKYWDKGSMAIIGRHKAVVDMPGNKIHFRGFIAWFMWLFVHLMSLITFRNRVITLYNWTGAYFTKDQSLRMIIRPSKK